MKALVIFYSRSGTTRQIAFEIARNLQCEHEIEELTDLRKRSGFLGFLSSGRDAGAKKPTELAPLAHDPSAYDLVILGGPVWNRHMSPAVRTFIEQNRASFRDVALFCTHGQSRSDAGYRVLHEMEQLCGKKVVGNVQFSRFEVQREAFALKVQNFAVEVSIF